MNMNFDVSLSNEVWIKRLYYCVLIISCQLVFAGFVLGVMDANDSEFEVFDFESGFAEFFLWLIFGMLAGALFLTLIMPIVQHFYNVQLIREDLAFIKRSTQTAPSGGNSSIRNNNQAARTRTERTETPNRKTEATHLSGEETSTQAPAWTASEMPLDGDILPPRFHL